MNIAKDFLKENYPEFKGFIEHTLVAEMAQKYAEHYHTLQLSKADVSQYNEQLIAMLTSRVLTIKSEPDGIVRETMINNLLIDINCC